MIKAANAVSVVLLACALAACGGSTSPTTPPPSGGGGTTPPPPPPPPPPTPTGYGASLVPSAASPTVGQNVAVALVVSRSGGAKVGSFLASIAYDSTALKFVGGAGPSPDLVFVNAPIGGLVRVAGASVSGISSDPVVTIQMQVLKTGGLSSLTLTMSEITTVGFENETPSGDRAGFALIPNRH